jgi:hypothetical protein
MPPRTLQIAILGDNENAVLIGLRNFPAHKLTLLTSNDNLDNANRLAANLFNTLRLTVETVKLRDETIPTILEAIRQIIEKNGDTFKEILINVGPAKRSLVASAITAAYVYGITAFDVIDEQPRILPVLKLSYLEIISGAKLEILRALAKVGGQVNSLEELARASNYGKPLLSYHIRGTDEARGLIDLGLVEVDRLKQGRLQVKLSTLAHTLLSMAAEKSECRT